MLFAYGRVGTDTILNFQDTRPCASTKTSADS